MLLISLAFYYSEASVAQFQDGLRLVLKSDDPAIEYNKWKYDTDTLPESF
jgi:hypothetical protein